VSVQFKHTPNLTFTYPAYHDGWNFTIQPNGLQMGEKTYDYLFWDAEMTELPSDFSTSSGFLVSRYQLVAFFEESLSQMGLSTSEQQDFITYWVPQMLLYENLFIHFSMDGYAAQVPLDIRPKPDWMQRMFMIWSDGAHISTPPTPQPLVTLPRHGFAVLEWGGTQIPDAYFSPN
jgi:hypothetical protein